MKTIRKKCRIIAWLCLFSFLNQLLLPMVAQAGGGGPKQPEVQSFTPIGNSDVVDPFTGDFQYNIPLMEVEGYPLNIGYHSNITADQEASWVGLGWNLNPGSINREVRGLPDDFAGDIVTKEMNMEPSRTFGGSVGFSTEIFGFEALKANFGIGLNYNNYNGYGFDIFSGLSVGNPNKTPWSFDLGMTNGSNSGFTIAPSISYSNQLNLEALGDTWSHGISLGTAYNSRQGLQSINLNGGMTSGNLKSALKLGFTASTSYSFAASSYTPSINMPTESSTYTGTFKVGPTAFGLYPSGSLSGYYTEQGLQSKRVETPAYGYLHATNSSENVLQDINREKDGSFTPTQPNAAIPVFTHDVYNVTGQGISGSYRPFRGDMGHLHDRAVNISARPSSIGAGVDVGLGSITHIGVNVPTIFTNSHTGDWKGSNNAAPNLQFKEAVSSNPLYEPYYFKRAGEVMAENDPEFFTKIGGFDPVKIALGDAHSSSALSFMENDRNEKIQLTTDNTRKNREQRQTLLSSMDGNQIKDKGLDRVIYSYEKNDFSMDASGRYSKRKAITISNEGAKARPAHHMSEVTVTGEDGSRYVYGIPLYNYEQHEVTFAVGENFANCANGLVLYIPGLHNTTGNVNGLDNYFEKIKTPGYATAYLLTAIISPDFIDKTYDGPTDDDKGTYTKFNYTRTSDSYRWRVPFEKDQANHNEGLNSLNDDKASYLYGEKELWYLHSIETRTQVAEFQISDRYDGYGAADENGGRGSITMQALQRVTLYNKVERAKEMAANNESAKAVPIQTVHFEYDYFLCPNVPNMEKGQDFFTQGNGKLTLRKLFTTYGTDPKGSQSPYEFNYEGANPSYSLKSYDRWGNYKPNVLIEGDVSAACLAKNASNAEIPYTQQTKSTADDNATAWQLTSVDLPSGGRMLVNYEADDYAYVQDKNAMQMVKIVGTGTSANGLSVITSGEAQGPDNNGATSLASGDNLFVYFELKKKILFSAATEAVASKQVRDEYVRDLIGKKMYFKVFANVDGNYEFVPGYAEVQGGGAVDSPGNVDFRYGYIKLKSVNLADGNNAQVNPMSMATWNFIKLYIPRLAFQVTGEAEPGSDMKAAFEAVANAAATLAEPFTSGVNARLRDQGYGNKVISDKSFIRLYTPDGFKYGGGTRVKSILISDKWDKLCPQCQDAASLYGKTYEYTKTIIENGIEKVISSGVASYEPQLGGEENPFRQPVEYNVKLGALVPSDRYYQEEPFGESFFPSAGVGYSQVVIRDYNPANVKRGGTGRQALEFYTAQDFPTIVRKTTLDKKRYPGKNFADNAANLLSGLSGVGIFAVEDFITLSQGYVVELNDMHGKPKSVKVYPEGNGQLISSVEYDYKKIPYGEHFQLSNTVQVIKKNRKDGVPLIREAMFGVEYDFITDMRESETETVNVSINANVDFFMVGIFPVAVPVVVPLPQREKVRFRSAVTSKVIQRSGILEKVTKTDLGATQQVSTMLFDADTGTPVLTSATNEFKDPVYSFTFPAYWGYDRMGPAYLNTGAVLSKADITAAPDKYLVPGDEVMLLNNGEQSGEANWHVVSASSTDVLLANDQSNVAQSYRNVPGDAIKVMRSGRRNQLSSAMANTVALAFPITGTGTSKTVTFEKVLSATASTFSDQWPVECNCSLDDPNVENAPNDFFTGARGAWRMDKTYAKLINRNYTFENNGASFPVVRNDGRYANHSTNNSFDEFWLVPSTSGTDWRPTESGWILSEQKTQFSAQGFEMENKDALGRNEAVLYGFKGMLPVAVGSNAGVDEIFAESFEDAGDACVADEFSFKNQPEKITKDDSHSGRNSIRVDPGDKVVIKKDMKCQRIPVIR